MIHGLFFTSTNRQSLNKIVQKDPSIVSRKIADEIILVPIRHKIGEFNSLYAPNEVVARI